MMKLQRGFPDFDLDGKEIYLDRVRVIFFLFGSQERETVLLGFFFAHCVSFYLLFSSSLVSPSLSPISARRPRREDAHLRDEDAPVGGRAGEGVAAPGEEGKRSC